MKLLIINGENNNEKIEIQINGDSMVQDIKYKLDEILKGNGNFTKYYFKLIHKKVFLSGINSIKYYKICEHDEVWFGKIENYLTKDDAIVDVFHVGVTSGINALILKMNDTISTIKSIIENFNSEIINIWNADGKEMRNDQIVTEISINENYKLIIRCDDGKGNPINKVFDSAFDECCFSHDRDFLDQYLLYEQIRDDNKNKSIRIKLIKLIHEISQIISSNDPENERLNQNLSALPSVFFNSTHFFCNEMANRILDICNDYRLILDRCEDDVLRIFNQYFYYAM